MNELIKHQTPRAPKFISIYSVLVTCNLFFKPIRSSVLNCLITLHFSLLNCPACSFNVKYSLLACLPSVLPGNNHLYLSLSDDRNKRAVNYDIKEFDFQGFNLCENSVKFYSRKPKVGRNQSWIKMVILYWVKIAHSFLQFVSNQFHFIILSLSMWLYEWLPKNFSKPTSKNGEIGRFNRPLLIELF